MGQSDTADNCNSNVTATFEEEKKYISKNPLWDNQTLPNDVTQMQLQLSKKNEHLTTTLCKNTLWKTRRGKNSTLWYIQTPPLTVIQMQLQLLKKN